MDKNNGNGNSGNGKGRRRIDGKPDNDPNIWYSDYCNLGADHGLADGGDQSVAEMEDMVGEAAKASANLKTAAPYDPVNSYPDKWQEEQYQYSWKERRNREQEVAYARAELYDRQRDSNDLGDPPFTPKIPVVEGVLATCGISVSMVLALHDIIFSKIFAATNQALVAAGACGIALASFMVVGILATAKNSMRTWAHWLLIVLCLGFGMSLLLLRMGSAHTPQALLMAYGFGGLEMVTLLLLEVYCHGLRLSWKKFYLDWDKYTRTGRQLKLAEVRLADRLADLEEVKKRQFDHEDRVAERESLVQANPHILVAADTAARLGYRHGRETTHGYLYGARTKHSDKAITEENTVKKMDEEELEGEE